MREQRHACYPQLTPRTVHEICEETRAPAAASAAQSRPDCCAAVIYLHTAVHRLCLTSPGVTQMSAVTVVRAPTHCCSGWRAQASRGTHTDRTAGEATDRGPVFGPAHGRPGIRWTGCSIAVDNVILRYCRACGRGKQHFRARAWACARGRRTCRSNTVDTAVLRYCMVRKRSVLLP